MNKISVDKIRDNDILAKEIYTETGTVLLPAGTKLKRIYIAKLKELNIDEVSIEDNADKDSNIISQSVEERVKKHCESTFTETIQRYSTNTSDELVELVQIANEIITDILSNPQVLYNISLERDKSEVTYAHSLNVSALSVMIALKMKIDKKKTRDIAIGAMLHDLGIVFLPKEYLDMVIEDTTTENKKKIMKHVITGYSELDAQKWLSCISKDIVLYHHERCDGSGYPFHLKGERISTPVKIVSICDEFDSLAYGFMRKKMKVHEVLDYILSNAGVKFDFEAVKAFVGSVAAYPNGTKVLTNENEAGIVVRQNEDLPLRPVLRIIRHSDGSVYEQPIEKDLTKYLTVKIIDCVSE